MTDREFFVQLREQEHGAFSRVLKAVPPDKLDYRPHPRSRSAAELVWLFVYEGAASIECIDKGRVEWSEHPPQGTLADMIAAFERNFAAVSDRLKTLDASAWDRSTQALVKGQVVMDVPLGRMMWMYLLDAIHHRGQLSVYLRPMGGKVPSIYGPSGDDPGM
jgi:uncharacterized damage-inducible protein DinB